MVDSLQQINTRRLVLNIRRQIEQLMGAYVFDIMDQTTENKIRDNVKSLCNDYISRGIDVKVAPNYLDRSGIRKEMSSRDKIIDILEEEIEFKGHSGDRDVIKVNILITPPKQIEMIEVNFVIK